MSDNTSQDEAGSLLTNSIMVGDNGLHEKRGGPGFDPEVDKNVSKVSEDASQDKAGSQLTNGMAADNRLYGKGVFSIMDAVPDCHHFKKTVFRKPTNYEGFCKKVKDEIALLSSSLPPGIWVKAFGDRMDLFSVMIQGPENTPYEDGLFIFDILLPCDYPRVPPKCHYLSYSSSRLNPNLYVNGTVCVSLLGTWVGKSSEMWTQNSNLLQVVVSIQGLILVAEPVFNEPGLVALKGSREGKTQSKNYNESVIMALVYAMKEIVTRGHQIFTEEIAAHIEASHKRFCCRLRKFKNVSKRYMTFTPPAPAIRKSWKRFLYEEIRQGQSLSDLPDFPLLPASNRFCWTLQQSLPAFQKAVVDRFGSSSCT